MKSEKNYRKYKYTKSRKNTKKFRKKSKSLKKIYKHINLNHKTRKNHKGGVSNPCSNKDCGIKVKDCDNVTIENLRRAMNECDDPPNPNEKKEIKLCNMFFQEKTSGKKTMCRNLHKPQTHEDFFPLTYDEVKSTKKFCRSSPNRFGKKRKCPKDPIELDDFTLESPTGVDDITLKYNITNFNKISRKISNKIESIKRNAERYSRKNKITETEEKLEIIKKCKEALKELEKFKKSMVRYPGGMIYAYKSARYNGKKKGSYEANAAYAPMTDEESCMLQTTVNTFEELLNSDDPLETVNNIIRFLTVNNENYLLTRFCQPLQTSLPDKEKDQFACNYKQPNIGQEHKQNYSKEEELSCSKFNNDENVTDGNQSSARSSPHPSSPRPSSPSLSGSNAPTAVPFPPYSMQSPSPSSPSSPSSPPPLLPIPPSSPSRPSSPQPSASRNSLKGGYTKKRRRNKT